MRNRFALLIIAVLLLSLASITRAEDLIFTVNTTSDTDDSTCNAAHCSLREAINAANDEPGLDTIAFNIVPAGAKTIQIGLPLPEITDPVILDATTQPGFITQPIIELNGEFADINASGLAISAGGSTVSGFIINRFPNHGILLTTNGGNTITGNYIGTNAAGTADQGNFYSGISVDNIPNNTFGGTTPLARNVISGNENGIIIGGINAKNNVVQGNYIGTNASGSAAIPNDFSGVAIVGNASENTIGGAAAGAGNLISGNNSAQSFAAGVQLAGNGNVVQGNKIGTDVTGTQAIPNKVFGIWLEGTQDTQIGGEALGAGNLIAFNDGIGIMLRDTIGTGLAVRNAFLGNSIHSNTGLGIDLNQDGVTQNDLNDADNGPNKFQNFPVLTSATRTATSVTLEGTLNSEDDTIYRLEFFANDTCDDSTWGEGQTYLGATSVRTDLNGDAAFNVIFLKTVAAGKSITATSTRIEPGPLLEHTSEFSECITLVNQAQSPQTFNVTKTADTNDGTCNADCSLREAIKAANGVPGSTVNVPAGTYTLSLAGANEDNNATGDLDINANMTISGAGSVATIIDANDLDRIFHITGAYTVSISGMTVRNGRLIGSNADADGAGILNNGGALGLSNCTLSDNRAEQDTYGEGGGLMNEATSAATITNCTFSNNYAIENGGGIANRGTLVITNSSFTGNTVPVGGVYGGGAIFSQNIGSSVSISGSSFTNNSSNGGAAIYNYSNPLTISNSTFTNNSQQALYTNGGTIINTTFAGNTSTFEGGAILTFGEPLSVSGSTFVNNSSTIGGGAIYAWREESSPITITNSTFTGNSSPMGGAILVGDDSDTSSTQVNITHTTISGNPSGGGVYLSDNAVVTMHANILSGNAGGNCRYSPNPGEILISNGYNISSDTSCNSDFTGTGDANATNPLIDSLANNGGPTETIALQAASPAINRVPLAVCTVNVDQRGQARPVGGACDSGAYEFATESAQPGPTLTVNTTSDSNDGVCGALHCSLREAIIAANTLAGTNTIAFNIGGGGLKTIKPTSALPSVTQIAVIDGSTQPGYAGSPLIELDGSSAGAGVNGLTINAAGVVRALVINRFSGRGIVLSANGSVVDGSYIGTNVDGNADVGDMTAGIYITSSQNRIGGTYANGRNVIAGNIVGVQISGAGATQNRVLNNFIGMNAAGTSALSNQTGVLIEQNASGNTIGGTAVGEGNRISGNSLNGVVIGKTGDTSTLNNAVLSNRIDGNGGLGIDLIPAGVTPNDANDADTGSNNLQNFPVLTNVAVSGSTVTVSGTFNSIASKAYRVEFFANSTCDSSGNGEGQTFIGFKTVTTDATGNVTFSAALTYNLPAGSLITAAATDPQNNTSEFSSCLGVSSAPGAAPQRNYFTTSTPTLTWSRVVGAVTYEVEVDLDINFTNPVVFRKTGITTPSVTTDSLPDGTYYWRVRMVNASGQVGMWSLVDSFVVDAS